MDNNYFEEVGKEFHITKVSTQMKQLIVLLSVLGVSILIGVIYLFYVYKDYNITYDKVPEISQVQGKSVEGAELSEVTNLLDSYFTAVGAENTAILNGFCVSGSRFSDSITDNKGNMETSFDEYDSYIRGMSNLGGAYSVSSINDLIEKDGRYYAYITVNTPDVVDFLYSFEADLAQYFTTKGVTKETVMKHAYELMDRYEIPTDEKPMVLEFTKSADGRIVLADDTIILDMVTGSYDTAVNEVIRIAKLSLAKEQY